MKKVKAFTLIEALVVVAIVCILLAMLIPAIAAGRKADLQKKAAISYQIGDAVYIESLSVTGVVNHSSVGIGWSRVDLIVKSTNGTVTMLKEVEAQLVKRVPPNAENEWKR